MSTILTNASRLKPDIRLAQAVSQFEMDLSSEQKTTFRTCRSESHASPPKPSDVMRLTAEIDRRASGKVSGRCFGPRFTNFLQVVQQFAALGDVVVGGSQSIVACGVWSLVRMSLLLIVNSSSYLERLSTVFMNGGRSAPRYQAMALLYPRSKSLQSHLSEYFIVVVRLCHRLLKFAQKSTVQQVISSLSDSDIKTFQSELDLWANAIKEEISLLMAKKIEEEAQENSRFRALSSKLSISGSYQQRIYTKLRVLELCSKYDYETTWKQIRKVGNATFFCQAPEYKEWTAQAHSCTLIYTGKLGSGKSVLLANVVDDLHVHLQSKDITVTYFFCRHDIPESLKARTVIGSLARQLLRTIPDLTVAAEICDETSPTLDFEKILDLLRRTLPTDYKAYFVLDGLDECSQTDRDTLAQQLQKLQETFTLLLCISFRVEPNNALELSPRRFTATRIASIPDENPDIEAFIEAELERCLNSRELVIGEPTIILEIHDALLKGSQGMFLWVALQIQSLCAMGTDQAIRDALADLPKDLLETFSRILRRSKGLGEYNQRQILQIVTAARRPLTVDELREALSVVPGDTVWIPSRLLNNIYSALACCGCLLTVDEEELTIRFVHHSVKQFLLSSSQGPNDIIFTIESAQRIMADIVVTYLNYGVFGTQISTTKIPRIAVGSAPSRIIRSTLASSSSTQSLALKLLKSKNQPSFDVGKILAEAHNPLRSHSVHEFRFYSYAESHWLQHILCISEQEPTMYDLLLRIFKGNTVDIGAKDEGGRTPLERAAEGGHETVVKLLLDSGKVDANLDDSDGWMLLRRVAENGHEAVVKLLLDSGKFDANLIKAGGMTPLSQAAQNGDEVVAKLLLDSDKVDANSMDASGRTPLSRAAENGHEAIVKLLLGSGKVDANSMDASGRTPLWWAAENSYEAIVKLLLDSGKVDANSMDASGRTPLWRAAEDGHEVVVKLLLGSGKVDANSMDASGRTPLWRAAENGHEAIVKLLLGSGKVDANLQDMNGRTLMLWAADDRRKSLYSQLDASLLDCALSRQKFLPLDILRMIITKEKVEAELPLTIRLFQPSLPAKVAQQAKKVFAILVLIGEPLAIKELLSEGITDEHLPLYRETEAASTDVLTSQDGKSFRSFDAWKMAVKVDEFLTKQWLVLAPVFDTTGRHFILNEKCALPFVEAEAISHEHYSITYRGVLHRAHQRGVTVVDRKIRVAIKEYRLNSRDNFYRERQNLEKIHNLHHPHLIQHYATCEIGKCYYIIFPWAAGGNLREFWERGDRRERTAQLALWSLRQMLGLAGAVKDLHSENCRHGDLKPENILQFNKADEELLVIADVSMSRIHKEATHLRTGGLTIRDTTSKYEAPEAYMYVKAPRSRKYDIWSLGCVFLEFVIWFLYDFEAIEIFSYDRAEVDNCMYFYTSTRKGIEIHPRVSEVIQVLRQDIRCQGGTGFEALLSLIEDSLLQVEVERRDTAIGVVTILEAILMEAEKSPSYMMNLSDALPTKPLVFQRQHRNPIACGFMDPLTTG